MDDSKDTKVSNDNFFVKIEKEKRYVLLKVFKNLKTKYLSHIFFYPYLWTLLSQYLILKKDIPFINMLIWTVFNNNIEHISNFLSWNLNTTFIGNMSSLFVFIC